MERKNQAKEMRTPNMCYNFISDNEIASEISCFPISSDLELWKNPMKIQKKMKNYQIKP